MSAAREQAMGPSSPKAGKEGGKTEPPGEVVRGARERAETRTKGTP